MTSRVALQMYETSGGSNRLTLSSMLTRWSLLRSPRRLSVGAVSHDSGYSTSNLGEAVMTTGMMRRAARVVVMADAAKFGRRLFAQVAGLGRADWFVTDTAPAGEFAEAFRAAGVEVLTPKDDGAEPGA